MFLHFAFVCFMVYFFVFSCIFFCMFLGLILSAPVQIKWLPGKTRLFLSDTCTKFVHWHSAALWYCQSSGPAPPTAHQAESLRNLSAGKLGQDV